MPEAGATEDNEQERLCNVGEEHEGQVQPVFPPCSGGVQDEEPKQGHQHASDWQEGVGLQPPQQQPKSINLPAIAAQLVLASWAS